MHIRYQKRDSTRLLGLSLSQVTFLFVKVCTKATLDQPSQSAHVSETYSLREVSRTVVNLCITFALFWHTLCVMLSTVRGWNIKGCSL